MTLRRVLSIAALAVAAAAGGCERPAIDEAPSRAPEVRFEPTPHNVVADMMRFAKIGPEDVVYDLGCGDGRIVIAAVRLGARGVCVDIDPRRIRESRANAERAGVAERILFLNQDLLDTGLADATVVTLFLSPELNLKVRPKLRGDLRPGTRVVSYVHNMGDWAPQQTANVESPHGPRKLFLWIIPRA
jgi:SAM-dependent methyltransferase